MQLHLQVELRKIMYDNATTIILPKLCSNISTIIVVGIEDSLINRSIRDIYRIMCQIYIGSIQISNIADSANSFSKTILEMGMGLARISHENQVEISIQKNIVDVYGNQKNAAGAIMQLSKMQQIKAVFKECKFQVELGVEHHEFINGKKNGKINKIIKTCPCKIIFSEHPGNMIIDIYSTIPQTLVQAVGLLVDELPAEYSFYIPETHHKRIIGVGGKNIQKVMKKYGVYVKFSNLTEFTELGGYYENSHNVICRTPAKNSMNLMGLKEIICESVSVAEDLNESERNFQLVRLLHSCILFPKVTDISSIRIRFPDCESGADYITVLGPLSQLDLEMTRLTERVPVVMVIDVPGTKETYQVLQTKNFKTMCSKQLELGVNMFYFAPKITDENFGQFGFSFYLIHPGMNPAKMESARQLFDEFFTAHNVHSKLTCS